MSATPDHRREYRRYDLLANLGVGLAVIGYVAACTWHPLAGALPFLAGMLLAIVGSHGVGQHGTYLAAWFESGEEGP